MREHRPENLMLTVLGGIAQFEPEMMLAAEGVAKAKAAGKYKGQKPVADAIRQEVVRLVGERMARATIASQRHIGEAAVYRILTYKKTKPSWQQAFAPAHPPLFY